MSQSLFRSKAGAVIVAAVAVITIVASLIGDKNIPGVLVLLFCLIPEKRPTAFLKWVRYGLLGLYSALCLADFLPAMTATANRSTLLSVGTFAGSLLVGIGSLLLLAGSLFDFEYFLLFRLGSLAVSLGTALSFTVTTLVVSRSGAFSSFGFMEGVSIAAVLLEALFFLSVFFFTKSKKTVNCLETDGQDSL